MQEKPARASHTDLQLNRKNADYTVFYDGFTVRFASPHSREKNRPKNIIDKQCPSLREIYLEGNRKVFNFKVQTRNKDRSLTISNVCSYIKGRLADAKSGVAFL
ncbi:hypothetical protein [Sphingobacterium haloxyli]|uniref:Uncharacterized protein n=1 Tax=Sphingobacterium haloxyli TaxID=2100533 RepID=A0A2S9J4B2_9SPHI|nr:hypothetical protein [Sphingobacterium haloxyli]PRD47627.1 hypothetical protein C5745_09985 [Sphingobacterium haloxyli]